MRPQVPTLRIAYVGLALGGKWTSMVHVVRRLAPASAWSPLGDHVVLHDEALTLELTRIGGSRFQPDADVQSIARADGIVFVVDSQRARWSGNEHWAGLIARGLALRGEDVPVVLSCNKRDFPVDDDAPSSPLPVDRLATLGAPWNARAIPCVATRGEGVWDAFADVAIRAARAHDLATSMQAWLARSA